MPLTARSIRRRFILLRALRWLPTGLLVPVSVLLMVERGMSLAQIGVAVAAQGLLVLLLEVPTGGLADALGRRPVLLAATVAELASIIIFFFADTLALFVLVFALQGVYRALESGPLDSWYVDAAMESDPDADIEGGLSAADVALGVAIAVGALASGGVVQLDPLPGIEALALPILLAVVLRLAEFAALIGLMHERRRGRGFAAFRDSVGHVPSVMGRSVRLVGGSTILLALVSVEIFWGFGMVTFENLLPPKLAEVAGGADHAAAILGPAAAAAWLVSAGGAALVPSVTRRIGAAMAAGLMRIVQGATVVAMALFGGVVGVLAMYLATYLVHGSSNPIHKALLHRQVTSENRTTVLSINSMTGLPAAAVGSIVLGWLADTTSVSTAMVVGGVILALAAPLYLPAHRASRRPAAEVTTS